MKKFIHFAWFALLLVGCTNDPPRFIEDADSLAGSEITQPDGYFGQSLQHFRNGDMASTFESLEDAIFFLATEADSEDTVHKETMDFAIGELESLKASIEEGSIIRDKELLATFSSVDRTIASYHLGFVETYYWNGGENKEGLNKLLAAVVRITYAAQYQNYPLTEEEQAIIASITSLLEEAERSSPEIWEETNGVVKQFKKALKKQRQGVTIKQPS
ncbi:MAG: hypothetical protein R8G66_11755 [Cytophagales bacterium]|nr:hypothetical protein [Cytophagales bacterium]